MEIKKYRMLRQACYDLQYGMVDGYELLLREFVDDEWRVPADFSILTPELFSGLVAEAMEHLPSKSRIMINLDHDQFVDRKMLDAIINVHEKLPDYGLTVELTERDNTKMIMDVELLRSAMYLTSKGVALSLDDVGSGVNQFELLRPLLPFVTELKFALQNFQTEIKTAYNKLYFWQELANFLGKKFVLGGIETEEDLVIARQLAVDYGQGYLYDRPQKFY
ncbi:protein containing diguanylate cyclase/phosphodiesterase domain 2 (EAL) [Pediococcus damnosus]|uniref:Protein containing diguanylate cyclase/phosphodiesterase domain 2 (EAL) n=1 Tax=Pediococcus damnosus TaxID=51663 RepID=A0AAC9B131_9LACO|nr:EAL domain-containing protein [Pediococcus damnosus]AMV61327.1 protein containing diguanylate cyclase/phosphodiesterase domain 2 (EAL) [Pediococcus damnosus]AMV62320.1 protein containing diguanylate cyclase/phosphodiesterase domain 2 (EAL) [Pediococcus damnosus]AMV65686.1 protein containing diguanylate cyclase/phosphodiesterase domain 2 (EAL) [Pediococcus damnosus]AMV67820.1 protein containing diguanylate cyclase/phosphodiesterase domain 2 (EAL) [Pediococcus damnosus]KJU74095.1 c-di-GMP pho